MYDQLLPVAPGGLDGSSSRSWSGPRSWRDTARSEPVIITPPAFEPLSRAEVKLHLRTGLTDEDAWVDSTALAARMLVEADSSRTFVQTVFEMTFDQFPLERWIPLPRYPLVSVQKVSSFDLLTNVETAFDTSNYFVDTYSQPGRVVLYTGKIWPVSVRWQMGGKIRWTAGYSGVLQAVASMTFANGLATVTTTAPHGASSGQQLTISGADQADYNGTFVIAVTGSSTFTYAIATSPVSPATGTISVATLGVPARYLHAIKLLLGNWSTNRDSSGVMRGGADIYPLGYEALVADRLVSLG